MKLSGWGNYPRAQVHLAQARGDAEIKAAVTANNHLIARGNGRSYGDCALNPLATLSMLRRDRLIDFNTQTGLLTCEAGILLSDMLSLFVPRGWFIPVTPGTQFVTVGGMIAADVHGKNHHHAGSFSQHVVQLNLMHADGEIIACSPTQNADKFWATCGGMGLTGIIMSAVIRLLPIETAYIQQTVKRTANLAETMQAFTDAAATSYSVAWIDCLATGDALGRSLLYFGEHAKRADMPPNQPSLKIAARKTLSVPCYAPGFLLNRFSAAAFNHLYYACAKTGDSLVDLDRFFYPLDRIQHWNRLYGRKGLLQYQCVLPLHASAVGIAALLERIRSAGLGAFLAVLKLLGDEGKGPLSFPMRGYTLALDFPATEAVFALLRELDTIVAAHGGRVYLAKDARMDAAMLRQGYPRLDVFLQHRVQKFTSLQSQRLGLS
jgi:FAD/FMN-containing dehydrogenase